MTEAPAIGPLGWRLQQLFTGRPGPFGPRSPWHSAYYLHGAMLDGGVKMRLCRIPAEHVAEAMIQRPDGEARESAEHRQMKRACLLWMRALGTKDAAEEQDYCAGIADVLSVDLNWVVECGYTGIDKPQTLMLADHDHAHALVRRVDALDAAHAGRGA